MEKNLIQGEPRLIAFSIDQFAHAAGLSKPVVYELIHSDGFPALRVGKRWLIPIKAVEEWLSANVGKQF